MRNFIFDSKPLCNGGQVKLKDENGKESTYSLKRVKGNGCVLSVWEGCLERDQVVFTMQDLRALYYLLSVQENG